MTRASLRQSIRESLTASFSAPLVSRRRRPIALAWRRGRLAVPITHSTSISMVTLRVVRHDRHEQVLAECQSTVHSGPRRGAPARHLDATGEKSRPSTIWRVVSVTVHVPSLASSAPRDGSPLAVQQRRGRRAARHRARARVRRGGRADPVRIEDVICAPSTVSADRSESDSHEPPPCTPGTQELPAHLRDWQLPPGWSWGAEGLNTAASPLSGDHRRARPVAVAGERARTRAHTHGSRRKRGTSRIATIRRCRRRTTTGRRSRRVGAVPAICAAGSPAKRSARDCARMGTGRRSRRAARACARSARR